MKLPDTVNGHILEGGGRLWLDPRPGSGLVAVRVGFPGSALAETPGEFGYSGLLAEILRAGAGTVDELEWLSPFDRAGGGLHAWADNAGFGLACAVLPAFAEEVLDRLRSLLAHWTVPAVLFERERRTRLSLLREEADAFSAHGLRLLRQRYFGDDPLGDAPLGRAADLSGATPDSLTAFGHRLLRRGGLVLAVSGDFEPGPVHARADALVDALPEGSANRREPDAGPAARGAGRFHLHLPREQALLCDAYPAPGYADEKESVRLQWLLHSLNGLSGPLFEEVREKRGLAYYTYAVNIAAPADGCLAVLCGCRADQVKAARACVREQLERFAADGPSAEERESGRMQLLADLRFARQRAEWRAARLVHHDQRELPVDLGETEETLLRQTDPKDLQACAARLFAEGCRLEGTLLPELDDE